MRTDAHPRRRVGRPRDPAADEVELAAVLHLDRPTADALMADLRAALAERIVVLVSHRVHDRRAGDVVVRLGDARAAEALTRAA